MQNIRGENVGMLDRSDFTSDKGLRDLGGVNVPNAIFEKKGISINKVAQSIHNIPFLPNQPGPPSRTSIMEACSKLKKRVPTQIEEFLKEFVFNSMGYQILLELLDYIEKLWHQQAEPEEKDDA